MYPRKLIMNNLALTPAEQNERKTIELVADTKVNFLELGYLLVENQKHAYWSRNGHHSFAEYIETLGVGSKSWVYRLMQIAEVVSHNKLTEAEVMEIGVGKVCLLLSGLNDGKIDVDTIELAKHCPTYDLRIKLGKASDDEVVGEEYLLCPRCGQHITFRKEMIRR